MSTRERAGQKSAIDPVQGSNPVLVEVTRGKMIESRHRGAIAIVGRDGHMESFKGDIAQPIYPRSAIKIFQALPVVESGAADAFELTDAELALIQSSHSGEPRHVDTIAAILARAGLSVDDLECGVQWPMGTQAARELARCGQDPTPMHNNCSGKHTGMLLLAKHLGVPIKGYSKIEHPVQQRNMGVLEFMTGYELGHVSPGFDGCSAPTWPMPLANMAYAFAQVADPEGLPHSKSMALRRLRDAAMSNPFMIAGSDRYCTRAMELLDGKVFMKLGAEGVYGAALPEYGLGVALKCDDGAVRGAEMMMTAVLDHIGVIDEVGRERFEELLTIRLENWKNIHVGDIRASFDAIAF